MEHSTESRVQIVDDDILFLSTVFLDVLCWIPQGSITVISSIQVIIVDTYLHTLENSDINYIITALLGTMAATY